MVQNALGRLETVVDGSTGKDAVFSSLGDAERAGHRLHRFRARLLLIDLEESWS